MRYVCLYNGRKIGFLKMLTVFVGEITALILACAKWLEHIDLIKIESEGY